jgi:mannosyltransferase
MLTIRRAFVLLFGFTIFITTALVVWSTGYIDGDTFTRAKEFFTSDGKLKSGPEIDISPSYQPLLEEVTEPSGELSRLDDERVDASFVSLVRNSELNEIVRSMTQIEARFNNRFNYPWTFFNDQEFTSTFKERVSQATNANCTFIKIEPEDWLEPEWIDQEKARNLNIQMKEVDDVQYAEVPSYHRMCRWNSGKFFENPAMDQYKYYWRVEPKTEYYCDIDYDVFAFMEQHDKDYGFVINLYDSPQSIRTLWPTSLEFFQEHESYIHENNALQWLVQDQRASDHNNVTGGYSTCHFWSNFEIGNLDFFRSQKYKDYFNHLDKNGGFFYERWGDAPVHSIGLAMMTDKSRIHWFKDIGYKHPPYFNCPKSDKCRGCTSGKFSEYDNLGGENCMPEWLKVAGDA